MNIKKAYILPDTVTKTARTATMHDPGTEHKDSNDA